MNIKKIIKDKGNKYKVIFDDEEVILYDDVILKYSLGLKNNIDESLFNEIIEYNDFMKYYYLSLKYLNNKLRCEKEIRDYLNKKEILKNIQDKVIDKLKSDGYLNIYTYLNAYINDELKFSSDGPNKIKSKLIKLGFNEEDINEVLNKQLKSINISDRIESIINKKINSNKSYGNYYLKKKLLLDLLNLGYNKEDILDIINSINIDDSNIYKKENEKAYNKYSKKYSGYELDMKVNNYLYKKGFSKGESYEE